jgi:mutator protein MutT
MANYIQWIREQVGHEPIILNFAAAIIQNEQGEILLQKRGDSKGWGLPGGAIELGESAEDAMRREVFEETGLRVKVEDFLGVYTRYFSEYPNGDQAQSIAFFFICSIDSGTLHIDHNDGETLDLQFFPPESAPRLYNQQSQEALNDFIQGKRGVCR